MSEHAAGHGRHRAEVRPRYGRIAALGTSVAVVVIAVLGGNGALPSSADEKPGSDPGIASGDQVANTNTSSDSDKELDTSADQPRSSESETPVDETPSADPSDDGLVPVDPGDATLIDTALPGDSGSGKRVVFSEGRQRVWLVDDNELVIRTYLVSGSIYDNLDPGTFEVYSRDEDAVGIEDSGTMKLFVRFTQGDTGAAIGFHDIPVDDGQPVQTLKQLGTPLSHGCIRQKHADAVALWEFAPIGTTVVVTA